MRLFRLLSFQAVFAPCKTILESKNDSCCFFIIRFTSNDLSSAARNAFGSPLLGAKQQNYKNKYQKYHQDFKRKTLRVDDLQSVAFRSDVGEISSYVMRKQLNSRSIFLWLKKKRKRKNRIDYRLCVIIIIYLEITVFESASFASSAASYRSITLCYFQFFNFQKPVSLERSRFLAIINKNRKEWIMYINKQTTNNKTIESNSRFIASDEPPIKRFQYTF